MSLEVDIPAVCGTCGGGALVKGVVRYCIACARVTVDCTCKTKV